MKNAFKKITVATAVAGATLLANAAPVLGIATLNTGLVEISFNEIDWSPSNAGPAPMGSPTYGTITNLGAGLGGLNTGSFMALPATFSTGTIQDMSNNPLDGNYAPVGANAIQSFLTFGAMPNWLFSLTNVAAGTEGPYSLTQVGSNVSATLSMGGLICDMATLGSALTCDVGDDLTKWNAIFTANFANITIAQLIDNVINGVTPIQRGFSGTITASEIPEPSSVALLGLGLVGLAVARRRRSVK